MYMLWSLSSGWIGCMQLLRSLAWDHGIIGNGRTNASEGSEADENTQPRHTGEQQHTQGTQDNSLPPRAAARAPRIGDDGRRRRSTVIDRHREGHEGTNAFFFLREKYQGQRTNEPTPTREARPQTAQNSPPPANEDRTDGTHRQNTLLRSLRAS